MPAIFAFFSLILAACGVAIAAAGIKAATDDHSVAGGSILITLGIVALYPAYLFARTAWRTRNTSVTDSATRARRTGVLHFFFWYVLAGFVVVLLLPISGVAKVTLTIIVVAGSVAGMAARSDPQRRQVRRGRRRSNL
jgi:type IV secretory pathway TrbD component